MILKRQCMNDNIDIGDISRQFRFIDPSLPQNDWIRAEYLDIRLWLGRNSQQSPHNTSGHTGRYVRCTCAETLSWLHRATVIPDSGFGAEYSVRLAVQIDKHVRQTEHRKIIPLGSIVSILRRRSSDRTLPVGPIGNLLLLHGTYKQATRDMDGMRLSGPRLAYVSLIFEQYSFISIWKIQDVYNSNRLGQMLARRGRRCKLVMTTGGKDEMTQIIRNTLIRYL